MARRLTKGRPVSPTLAIDDIYLVFIEPASLPSAPQMTVPSLATRPRSYLTRAGSLTESRLTANASRRSEGPHIRKDSYDSSESRRS
jgi:hypothetical protein